MSRHRWLPRWAADVAVLGLTAVTTAMLVVDGRFAVTKVTSGRRAWWVYLLVVVAVAPLLLRRSRPVLAFVGTTAAMAVLVLADAPVGMPVATGVALYAVASSRVPRASIGGLIALVAGGFTVYAACCAISIAAMPWAEILHTALLWSACWFAGERTRLQREQVDDLRRQAERERELAVAEERTRIARDLHDAAGHTINVIAVQAAVGRLHGPRDPERALTALSTIEDLSRRTVAEIDRLVGGLRAADEPSDVTPPSLASLPVLVAQHSDAGQCVRVDVHGAPRSLPAPVDLAAYRIVQEGLTNAARHGRGGADVRLVYGDEALTITVSNPVQPEHPPARQGHGLIGARERAGLAGGSLSTRLDGGTFELVATLPCGREEIA